MRADTIVLIHGLWLTPRSWEHWRAHYEAQGYRVIAPAYPGLESEVETLRADPGPIERLTVPAIVDHLEEQITRLDRPPIIVGHCTGGLLAQILLQRGHGSAGIAINPAPIDGIRASTLSNVGASSQAASSPERRRRIVDLTPLEWRQTLTNTMAEQESAALYQRYHVPATTVIWHDRLSGRRAREHWVLGDREAFRAPLLLIAGRQDRLFPPKVTDANAAHYGPDAIAEVVEFDGPHLLPNTSNWRVIADYALSWAHNSTAVSAGHSWTIDPSLTRVPSRVPARPTSLHRLQHTSAQSLRGREHG